MTEKSTEELVGEVRKNGASAFEPLVTRFQDMAVGYALGRLGDRDVALDVAQDAFTDAYQRLPQLREPVAFPGWFRKIVHKHCDRHTRRLRPTATPVPDRLPALGGQADAMLESAQDSAWLIGVIEALPEHERLVVALHYLGETAQKDVAEFLEVPLTTVKKRLHSARNRIRDRRIEMDSDHAGALRPSRTPKFRDRIQLFLAIRASDSSAVEAVLARSPGLVHAEERWDDQEALDGGFPLSHRLTPLILAAGRGDETLVELLLKKGARADGMCGCPNGETALWASVRAGKKSTAELLLTAGADPNTQNVIGLAPLHLAAMRGRREMVELLLKHGAKTNAIAKNGMTAADWAEANRHPEVFALLAKTPLAPVPARSVFDETNLVTGIKAVDLFTPIRIGDVVRIHGAAETGLTVLVSELSRRILDGGGAPVWLGWEPQPWQLGELDALASEAGIDGRVSIVKARGGHAEDRLAAVARTRKAIAESKGEHSQVALFVFEEEGHSIAVEAALATLAEEVDVLFLVQPWIPVTRGQLSVPEAKAPYDAVICTDPVLASKSLYPAIHPLRSQHRISPESQRHQRVRTQVQELLGEGRATDRLESVRAELVRAYLCQPFLVAEHLTGEKGEAVPPAQMLDDLERILAGELDEIPAANLKYLGALPKNPEASRVRIPEWS